MENRKEIVVDTVMEFGGSAAGAAVGAAIGTAIAGPLGSVGGALVGTGLEKAFVWAGKEIKERCLSVSENKKIASVYAVAKTKIENNLNVGKELRSDRFFEGDSTNRSSAEEVLEGTLFAAQRESEEKKLPYLANLYANINFDEIVSGAMANHLIKIASDITYRQIVILAIIGKCNNCELDLPLRKHEFRGFENYHDMSIAAEIFDLYRMSLLISKSAILDAASFTPAHLLLNGMGELLYQYMELRTVPMDDVASEIVVFLTDSSLPDSDREAVTAELPIRETVESILDEHRIPEEAIDNLFNIKVKQTEDRLQQLENEVSNIPRIGIRTEENEAGGLDLYIDNDRYVNDGEVSKQLEDI